MTVTSGPIAFGPVTGVTLGGSKPDIVNVQSGGDDGIDALWCWPGTLQAGDDVIIEQYGSKWLVVACTSRKVAPPDLTPVIDFATTTPADGKQLSTPYRRADSTDAKPHISFVYSDGTVPVIPAGANTQSFTATGGGTWDEVNGWRPSTVRQGIYPGFSHQAFGLWLLPTTIPAALAGVTVTRCDATVTRLRDMGTGGPVPGGLHLYSHGYTAPPLSQPAMLPVTTVGDVPQGAKAPFAVPLGTAQAIAAGTIVGLGITAASVSDYCGYNTDLTLTFYY